MRKTLYTVGLLCCIIGCTEHDSVTGFNGLATPITINSEPADKSCYSDNQGYDTSYTRWRFCGWR